MDREFSSPFRDYGGNVYRRWPCLGAYRRTGRTSHVGAREQCFGCADQRSGVEAYLMNDQDADVKGALAGERDPIDFRYSPAARGDSRCSVFDYWR
jgi:hypothetical protein